MKRSRLTWDVPGLVVRGRTEADAVGLHRSVADAAQVRREVHGPTYQMVPSDQHHAGDPQQQLALREPRGYQRPQSVLDLIIAGAPRVLAVSQEVGHGPEQSRTGEFEQAIADLGALHYALGFRDRRFEGRRYRSTDNIEDLFGPQKPYF
jgi:hypothetical protein